MDLNDAIIGGTIVAVIAVIVIAVLASLIGRRRLDRRWRELAERLGGTYTGGRERRIVAVVDGWQLTLGVRYRRTAEPSVRTYVVCEGAALGSTTIELYPSGRSAGAASGLARRLLSRALSPDASTGDPAFDDAFLLRTSDVPVALQVLDDPLRRALLRLDFANLRMGDGRISAGWAGEERDPDRLVAAAHAVSTWASTTARLE